MPDRLFENQQGMERGILVQLPLRERLLRIHSATTAYGPRYSKGTHTRRPEACFGKGRFTCEPTALCPQRQKLTGHIANRKEGRKWCIRPRIRKSCSSGKNRLFTEIKRPQTMHPVWQEALKQMDAFTGEMQLHPTCGGHRTVFCTSQSVAWLALWPRSRTLHRDSGSAADYCSAALSFRIAAGAHTGFPQKTRARRRPP